MEIKTEYAANAGLGHQPHRHVCGSALTEEREVAVVLTIHTWGQYWPGVPLPKTPSALVKAGAGVPEMLIQQPAAVPVRSRRSMRHDGLPCYCDWRIWV